MARNITCFTIKFLSVNTSKKIEMYQIRIKISVDGNQKHVLHLRRDVVGGFEC